MAGQNVRTRLRALGGFTADEFFVAAVDLSVSGVGRWVSPGSVAGEVILATGASNPIPWGVLQNSPTAGKPARVRMFGRSTVTACPGACWLKPGTLITSGSIGEITPGVGGACIVTLGRWLTASTAASSTTGEAFLNSLGWFSTSPVSAS